MALLTMEYTLVNDAARCHIRLHFTEVLARHSARNSDA